MATGKLYSRCLETSMSRAIFCSDQVVASPIKNYTLEFLRGKGIGSIWKCLAGEHFNNSNNSCASQISDQIKPFPAPYTLDPVNTDVWRHPWPSIPPILWPLRCSHPIWLLLSEHPWQTLSLQLLTCLPSSMRRSNHICRCYRTRRWHMIVCAANRRGECCRPSRHGAGHSPQWSFLHFKWWMLVSAMWEYVEQ